MDLIKDTKIKKGFKLKGLNSIRDGHSAIKLFSTGEKYPDWFLCQWNSKYNLVDGRFIVNEKEYSISDKTKKIAVYSDGTIDFNLLASQEFCGPRKMDEPWPHLLIEQEITENNKLKDMNKIECSARVILKSLRDYMENDKNDYHTVQFVWVLTFKDGNPNSKSYGSFIWVVMCPFDMRYDFAPIWTEQDTALPNGEFIFSLYGKDFMDKPLKVGSESNVNIDLYPKVKEILERAQTRGFMKYTKFEDLEISSTNMGFEITGTFDCNISVKDMQINVQ